MDFYIGISLIKDFYIRHKIVLANSIAGSYSDFSLTKGVHFLKSPFPRFYEIKGLLNMAKQNRTFSGVLYSLGVPEKKLAFEFFF
jgi:hypothetical protein